MARKLIKETIHAKGVDISIYTTDFQNEFISLTDIARYKNPEEPNVVIANWMRNRNTIEYLGLWEQLYNTEFKPLEFEGFLHQAGANAFTLSPMKWIDSTNAIGIAVKKGRGGGTYAHKDIAFKFAAWLLIEQGKSQKDRLILLHNLAVKQMRTMEALSSGELLQIPPRHDS